MRGTALYFTFKSVRERIKRSKRGWRRIKAKEKGE